jgi:hypothetical protein
MNHLIEEDSNFEKYSVVHRGHKPAINMLLTEINVAFDELSHKNDGKEGSLFHRYIALRKTM